jgi:hypothetical protein
MRLVAPGRDQTPGEANASGRASLRSPMLAAAGWRKFSQQACPLGSLKNYGNRRLGPRPREKALFAVIRAMGFPAIFARGPSSTQ